MEVFFGAVPVRAGGVGLGGSDGARRGAEALATAPGGVLRIHKMGRDKEANFILELRYANTWGIKHIGEF